MKLESDKMFCYTDMTRKCVVIVALSSIFGTDDEIASLKILSLQECLERLKTLKAERVSRNHNPKIVVKIEEDPISAIEEFGEPLPFQVEPTNRPIPDLIKEFKEEFKENDDIKYSKMFVKFSPSLIDKLKLASADFEVQVDQYRRKKMLPPPPPPAVRNNREKLRRSSGPCKPQLGRVCQAKFTPALKPTPIDNCLINTFRKIWFYKEQRDADADNKENIHQIVDGKNHSAPRKRRNIQATVNAA